MKNNRLRIICLIASTGLFTSGCATTLLEKQFHSDPIRSKKTLSKKVFSDEIISYGLPVSPIKNHEYSIAMAGNQYSYLIEPSDLSKKTLFHDFVKQVDTRYLAFTTPKELTGSESEANSDQQMTFQIKDNQINQTLMFMFIKPTSELKENELKKMQQLQFQCDIKNNNSNQKNYLICKQSIKVALTAATKARNTHQLTQKFRKPLTFDFYEVSEKSKINYKKIILTPFYPLTITYDIISLPVIAGLAYVGIEGPADKAFEGFFRF